jgi:hypothetical protein
MQALLWLPLPSRLSDPAYPVRDVQLHCSLILGDKAAIVQSDLRRVVGGMHHHPRERFTDEQVDHSRLFRGR